MSDKDLLSKLQSTINFYQESLKDYEKALNYCPEHFKEYDIIINKMLECSDTIDKCNRIINNEKTKKL